MRRRGCVLLSLCLSAAPSSQAWSPSHTTTPPRPHPIWKPGRRSLPVPKLSATESTRPMMTPSIPKRPHDISVYALLASAFLNLLGFTMAGPITPALGQHFSLNVGASFGSLTSAYPLGMLFGLFLWPSLSDRIGRKPVIAGSLLGSGLGLAFQSFVIRRDMPLGIFLATRVLTGSFAGSSPVSKAYLADVGAASGELPRYLALRDAAATMAYVVGPVLGGLIYEARRMSLGGGGHNLNASGSLAFVIGLSACASMLASVLVFFGVKELQAPKRDDVEKGPSPDTSEIIACPLGSSVWTGVATVCVISFLFNVGDSTFFAFFPALLRERLGFDARAIGMVFTLFACVSFSVSATLSSRSVRRFGPVATCVAGLSAVSISLTALAAATSATVALPAAVVLGASTLYYCGVPLYGPTIPTMLLQCVPSNKRGAVMGLDGAVNTLARVISPLVLGEIYRRYGPSRAFGLAGVAVFGAAVTAVFRRLVVLKEMKFREKPERKTG